MPIGKLERGKIQGGRAPSGRLVAYIFPKCCTTKCGTTAVRQPESRQLQPASGYCVSDVFAAGVVDKHYKTGSKKRRCGQHLCHGAGAGGCGVHRAGAGTPRGRYAGLHRRTERIDPPPRCEASGDRGSAHDHRRIRGSARDAAGGAGPCRHVHRQAARLPDAGGSGCAGLCPVPCRKGAGRNAGGVPHLCCGIRHGGAAAGV